MSLKDRLTLSSVNEISNYNIQIHFVMQPCRKSVN